MLPRPGLLWAFTAPPWILTSSATMANPMPLPSVPCAADPRQKRSNTCPSSSGLMPGPVSLTAKRAEAPSGPTSSSTLPPAGVYFKALVRRLVTTW